MVVSSANEFSKNSLPSPASILWVSDQEFPFQNYFLGDPFFKGWTFIRTTDLVKIDSWPHILIICIDVAKESHLSLLEKVHNLYPDKIRILIGSLENQESPLLQLSQAINKGEIFAWAESTHDFDRVRHVLSDAIFEAESTLAQKKLRKEASLQNRELEKLTDSLEESVTERTLHIQDSKEAEEEKVAKLRGLIRFIQSLSLCGSFEDLLDLLRKDLRVFHQVQEPILIYEIDSQGPHIIFWRQSELCTKKWPHLMSYIPHIHLHDPEMSRSLANFLSRPFAKALVIPIQIPVRDSSIQPTFHLVLENSMLENELNEVLDFCLERLQPLSTAIERIHLENELLHFSFRWEKTFDGLKDPIAIIDREDHVLRANKKFTEQLLPKTCYQSFAKKDTRCEGCPVPDVFSQGLAKTSEVRVRGRIYEVHSYPIALVQNRTPSNVVNQYIDRTQEKETYMRLLQSEKMGALGLLAGNIAHELNNPLTGLRSLAQVLLSEIELRGDASENQTLQDLKEIEKAAERSQSIIRNLLEFVQNKERNLLPVNLDDLVEKTLPFLKTAFRFHRLKKNLNTKNVYVRAEPQLLQQVIFNLIHNACQAMEKTGEVQVRTEKQAEEVFLFVEDTGPGIPPEIIDKIFEPFFTTKKEGNGTGLGLSLSREIVQSLQGQLTVKSLPGEGSSFCVSLPIMKEML